MTPSDENVDLTFLAEQIRRITTEVGGVRDDLRVLTAMVLRMDHTRERHEELLTDMLREIRAMNQQQGRLSSRVERFGSRRLVTDRSKTKGALK